MSDCGECANDNSIRCPECPHGPWMLIDSAPKDGTRVLVWVLAIPELHPDSYSSASIAEWIDHNGGGWTWHGLAGTITHWMPLPDGPEYPDEEEISVSGSGDE